MARKPASRKKGGQVSFRVNDWVMDAYSKAVEEVAEGVTTGSGSVLNQSVNFEWWARWWTELPPAERARWSRTYRATFLEALERREREMGGEGEAAASPQESRAPSPTAETLVGGHTVGHKASIADVFGKPVKAGPARRTERKKLPAS